MTDLTLVIGNKNYSSWSMRPWLALKKTGQPFREEEILLRQDETKRRILRHSPSGKVPALRHGEIVVWESLAICEYLAETFPAARAHARAIASEMHAGFRRLRENMPVDVTHDRSRDSRAHLVRDEIERIAEIWAEARARWGTKANGGGPFLYGDFTNADAMYAPVATRFRTYGVVLDEVCNGYVNAVLEWPACKEWQAGALRETAVIEFEIFRQPRESLLR